MGAGETPFVKTVDRVLIKFCNICLVDLQRPVERHNLSSADLEPLIRDKIVAGSDEKFSLTD